jgi:drug/metabolite transporter (DMT)-like permease
VFVWKTPNLEQFAWLILIGAFGALTQRALARSFHAADATVVITLDFIRLPVAALIGLAVFGEWPAIWVWIGSIVIVASSFLLTKKEVDDKEVNKPTTHAPS